MSHNPNPHTHTPVNILYMTLLTHTHTQHNPSLTSTTNTGPPRELPAPALHRPDAGQDGGGRRVAGLLRPRHGPADGGAGEYCVLCCCSVLEAGHPSPIPTQMSECIHLHHPSTPTNQHYPPTPTPIPPDPTHTAPHHGGPAPGHGRGHAPPLPRGRPPAHPAPAPRLRVPPRAPERAWFVWGLWGLGSVMCIMRVGSPGCSARTIHRQTP